MAEAHAHQNVAVDKAAYIKKHDLETIIGQITDAMIEVAVKANISDPKTFFEKVFTAVKDCMATDNKEHVVPAADHADNAHEDLPGFHPGVEQQFKIKFDQNITQMFSRVDKFVIVNNAKLHYIEHNECDDKPTFLLIHGVSCTATAWDDFASLPELQHNYRVIALDCRGHGLSEHARPYSLENMVHDVLAFVEFLKVDKVSLAGWSMGGLISMTFAGKYPKHVEKLIVVDMATRMSPPVVKLMTSSPSPLAVNGFVKSIDEAVEFGKKLKYMQPLDAEDMAREYLNRLKPQDHGEFGEVYVYKCDFPAVIQAVFGWGDKEQTKMNAFGTTILDLFANITCPILNVAGEHSECVLQEHVDEMTAANQRLRCVIIPRAGHSVFHDQLDAFSKEVLTFLDPGLHCGPGVDKFVTVNNVKLHYIEHHECDNKPILLLIHGVTCESKVWDDFASLEELQARYRVIALDCRGHGYSEHARPYTLENYIHDTLAFINFLKVDKVSICGWSMGGMIGMFFTGLYPKMVDKLIVVDVATRPSLPAVMALRNPPFPPFFKSIDGTVEFFKQKQFLFAVDDEKKKRDAMNKMKTVYNEEHGDVVIHRCDFPAVFVAGRDWTDEKLSKYAAFGTTLLDLFSKIECPILNVAGEISKFVLKEHADEMCSANDRLRCVTIPGAGHSVFLDDLDAFSNEVVPFLVSDGEAKAIRAAATEVGAGQTTACEGKDGE